MISLLKDAATSNISLSKECSELVSEKINNKVTLSKQVVSSTRKAKELSINLKHVSRNLEEANKVEDRHQQKINNLKREKKKKIINQVSYYKDLVQ